MNFAQIVRSALLTLQTQKLRTALTLFGMIWGTASVVFLLAWGLGLERMLESGFTRLGKNVVHAWPGKIGEDFTPAADRRELWFTPAEVEAVEKGVRNADLVLGESRGWYPVTYGSTLLTRDVRGVEPRHMHVRGTRIAAGRAITRADVGSRHRVAVLGDTARQKILGPEGRLGATIRILGTPFEVIGFFERVGTQLTRDADEIDEQVWIPITALHGIRPGRGADREVIDIVVLRARSRETYDDLKTEVRSILARQLGVSPDDEEAVIVMSPIENLKAMPIDQMRGMLFVLAVTTLGIGGIGILNMMLDSVQERRQEIGVRLAVGARRRDVVGQFFLETLVVTGVGGLVGLGLGVGLCALLGSLHAPDVIPLPILRAWIVWTALGVMTLVGVLSGLIPAWRAAGVDPSVTLRAE
ncbi:MAG: ABC transporter permease [Deltaproteobacteria bacterium]|nr:ABC transporter permease [Deltaproteobacteria bacterium]